jgi:hypothetical protein
VESFSGSESDEDVDLSSEEDEEEMVSVLEKSIRKKEYKALMKLDFDGKDWIDVEERDLI